MSSLVANVEKVPVGQLSDQPDSPHPLIYADQISALGIGAFVSRVILSVENPQTSTKVPAVTLVMPTNILHQLAAALNEALGAPDTKAQLQQVYDEYMDKGGSVPVASNEAG